MNGCLIIFHITDGDVECYGDCGKLAVVRLDGGQGFHNTPLCPNCAAEYVKEYVAPVAMKH